ncbi:MAG: hypothetical protein FDZ75_07150 [Actinobacteria bacterium]|nr:MAG: hypothetical protein FDZ75_07150 [Actinomycetota bacterium]
MTSSDALSAPYSNTATITLLPTDDLSGVVKTQWRVDSGQIFDGTRAVVTGAGVRTLTFWSLDAAGNQESARAVAVTIQDTVAPITASDAVAEYAEVATVTLSPSDASGISHTYYRLDGGAPAEGRTVRVPALGTHQLEFWSVDTQGNTEVPVMVVFSVKRGVTVSASPLSVTAGYLAPVTLKANLRVSATGAGLSGRSVVVYRSYDGVRFTQVKTVSSSSAVLAARVSGSRNAWYRFRYAGDANYAAAWSPTLRVRVRAALTTPSGPSSARRSAWFWVSGAIRPSSDDGPVLIRCYHRESGRWRLRKTFTAKVRSGRYQSGIALPLAGAWQLRAYHSDADHAVGSSAPKAVSVR